MLRRLAVVLALLAVPLAVAGCGGGGSSSTGASGANGATSTTTALSESEYCQQLAGPLNVKAPSTFNPSAIASTFGSALSELKSLTPPSSLQSLHERLVAAFSKLISDAKAGNPAVAAQDLRTLGALRDQANSACK